MEVDTDDVRDAVVLCSKCFRNEGLRLDAVNLGWAGNDVCPNCSSRDGAKLCARRAERLAYRFFVVGSLHRTKYGGAPVIQFNSNRKTELDANSFHGDDAMLLSKVLHIGFFYYGPPLWAFGEVEPLKALGSPEIRGPVIERILTEYPSFTLTPEQTFYRLRKGVTQPGAPAEYDSPPDAYCGRGRLDSPDLPILYGSADLQLCTHERRVTVEDQLYFATLKPTRSLTLLNLTALLNENVSSFESLDMAVHLLFFAPSDSYPITRAIANAAVQAGFDGIIFPSYFSLLRTGSPFLETAYGLSTRRFPGTAEYESRKIVENIGLFGRPIADGRVEVSCINRLYLRKAVYDLGFGPATT